MLNLINLIPLFRLHLYFNLHNYECSIFYACLFFHPWIGPAPGATSIATHMWQWFSPLSIHVPQGRRMAHTIYTPPSDDDTNGGPLMYQRNNQLYLWT